jgi:hypothetical protein
MAATRGCWWEEANEASTGGSLPRRSLAAEFVYRRVRLPPSSFTAEPQATAGAAPRIGFAAMNSLRGPASGFGLAVNAIPFNEH